MYYAYEVPVYSTIYCGHKNILKSFAQKKYSKLIFPKSIDFEFSISERNIWRHSLLDAINAV